MKNPSDRFSKEEALEIIELSSDSLDLLSRAFNLITDICEEESEDFDSAEVTNSAALVIH